MGKSEKRSLGKLGNVYWHCLCDCGKTTLTAGHTLTTGLSKSCGCVSRAKLSEMSHQRRGPLNSHYNPNLTEEDRRKLRTWEIDAWRKAVYARDNHTCQLTEQKGGDLEAHHIESWDANKEKRFDVTNGVTLAKKAHKLFHAIYGMGKNTKEQFDEFARDMHIAYAAT